MLLLMQQMFRRRHSQLPIKIGQQISGMTGLVLPFHRVRWPSSVVST